MPWWAIVCCGVFAGLLVLGAAVLLASLIRLGRVSRRLERQLEPKLEELQRATAELEARSARQAASQERLSASTARVRAHYGGLLTLWASLDGLRTGLKVLRIARAFL